MKPHDPRGLTSDLLFTYSLIVYPANGIRNMTADNLKLTVIVGKIYYYEQRYAKYGDTESLRNAEMYMQKAEELFKEMEQGGKGRLNKLYINR